MGIVSSIDVGGNDKCLNELSLDDIIDEVEGISGLLLVVAHSIKRPKQGGKTTDSVAAKNVLEELLRNAFDKLTCYYTIDVYTTCQELSDKKSPLLGSSNTTEEESHILAKIGLSDTITKSLLETLKQVKNLPAVDIKHLRKQVEKYSTGHSKGNSSQTPLSRENSKTNSDEQQNLRSERGKDHDEKKNHEVGKDQDTTETDNTRKRPVRDKSGNYLETDETKNITVGNCYDLTHADVGDIKTTPKKKDKTREIGRLQLDIQKLKIDIDVLKKDNNELKMDLKRISENNTHDVVQLNTHIKTKQNEIQSLKEENASLVLRLSKLAGEKLTKDNPNITDLSDPNRPTKLGEIYSELYDNQWTDAFEGLTQAGYQETEAIEALNITLKHAYKFCAEKASEMLTKTEDVAMQIFEACTKSQTDNESGQYSHSMRDEQFIERHWKPKQLPVGDRTGEGRAPNRDKVVVKPAKMESELVKLRKEVSLSMVPVVQQAYFWGKWNETCIEPLEPFIQKCLFLCWMMVVQSPPMVFDKNTEEGTRFESALYKQYTKSGDVFEYVVWPALLLHEDGPVLCKGVAQPKKAKE
ncbi:putative leucine-rich repeat-containing protein DDB_G0290503 isoform X2 [Mya arenaria]|uniref:putative leucine-rich repeat-containing protein DDB_G0290503 isoform X2 n=1 Tax=Mya arenaria TaxID=6604 RepID=UPI0022E1C09A|nr:putative leucine-rich repeat-containing protein DDB_G0290503 isoform X2 [Mya arenaria]